MAISKLELKNFRNFSKKEIDFGEGTTVIVGPNASGKTNILESLFLLSTGKSFKAKVQEEMISHDEEIGRVKGEFAKEKLEVVLTRGEITVGEDPERVEKAPRKRLLVNGVGKRMIDFAGNFKTVLFGPWDLDLVTESPSLRRNFLDTVLSQVDREYRRASLSYDKGLKRRNRVLYKIREEGISRSNLAFWDKLLIKNGDYLGQKRKEFIDFVNATDPLNEQKFSLEYDKSAISDARLEQYKEEEIAAATTLVGPHRDDFVVNALRDSTPRELARYGSRGEQRMGVLWLKLAELSFVKKETEETPTLLLDDIFSELDHEHREVAVHASKGQQTIITTADPHYTEGLGELSRVELKG